MVKQWYQGDNIIFTLLPDDYVFELSVSGAAKANQSAALNGGKEYLCWDSAFVGWKDRLSSDLVASYPNVMSFQRVDTRIADTLSYLVIYNSRSRTFEEKPCGGFVPLRERSGSFEPKDHADHLNGRFHTIRENLLLYIFCAGTFENLGDLVLLKLDKDHGYWFRLHVASSIGAVRPLRRVLPDSLSIVEFEELKTRHSILVCIDSVPPAYVDGFVDIFKATPLQSKDSLF